MPRSYLCMVMAITAMFTLSVSGVALAQSPIKVTPEELFARVVKGQKPAVVVFWGFRMGAPAKVRMGHIEEMRKQLSDSFDVYYAYVGKSTSFEGDLTKIKGSGESNEQGTFADAPFYIIEKEGSQPSLRDVYRQFECDTAGLKIGYPTAVLLDGQSKRLWQTDIYGNEFAYKLGGILYLRRFVKVDQWTALGKGRFWISPSKLNEVIGQTSIVAVEDTLRRYGYKFSVFLIEGDDRFQKEIFPGRDIEYIGYNIECDCQRAIPDVVIGLRAGKVVYAAFTAKPEIMRRIGDELRANGFQQGTLDPEPSGRKEKEAWAAKEQSGFVRNYWWQPSGNLRVYADGVRHVGLAGRPMIVEMSLSDVPHRWDKLLPK